MLKESHMNWFDIQINSNKTGENNVTHEPQTVMKFYFHDLEQTKQGVLWKLQRTH